MTNARFASLHELLLALSPLDHACSASQIARSSRRTGQYILVAVSKVSNQFASMKNRADMSEWVIHFVHRRNPDNEGVLYDENGDGETIPLHSNPDKASRFDLWTIKDRETEMESDAAALDVLLRILDDGHIRCGWSVRKRRPTIYGPRAACCFTEMPLYALLDYTRARGDSGAVDSYGIALLKCELFVAGARPVIYGLSRQHRECDGTNWPRMLHSSCGISEHEQYRYVAMNLKDERPIDWSHEREWRWADCEDKFDCPGLPVWLKNQSISFSKIILIVPTSIEAERLLDKLKLMRDAKTDGYDNPYQQELITRTRVLSLEEAAARSHPQIGKLLRIDDIPVRRLQEVIAAVPSHELLSKVETAVKKAQEAAEQGAKQWRESNGRSDVFGFAYLMVDGPRTDVVEALLQLHQINEIACSDGVGYRMANIGGSSETHLLGEAEAGVMAAKAHLEQELPGSVFRMRTVWD